MDAPVDNQGRVNRTIQPIVEQVGDVDLRQALKTLWRQKWTILLTFVVITGGTVAFVNTATPRYTADVQILFESSGGKFIDLAAAVEGRPQDEASVLGEIQVIKSRDLAQRVIDSLNLAGDPEFNRKLQTKTALARFMDDLLGQRDERVVPGAGVSLPIKDDTATNEHAAAEATVASELSPEETERIERERLVATFLDRLDVELVGRSRAIKVSFTSQSPITAAAVANNLADLYLTSRLEGKFDNARKASVWLADRAAKLRQQVEEAERAAESYRGKHNLLQGERGTMLVEQISDLNGKMTDASMQRSEAEANLAQVRRLAGSTVDVASAAQVLDSSLYQRLREQEVELERKEADLGQNLGSRHPAIIQLRAEKEKLQQNLQSEVAKIVRRLENQVEVTRRREAALAKDLNAMKQELAVANRAGVNLRTLERDAEANRLLLDKFMTAFMETTAQQDADSQLPDARIISSAAIPTGPSFPRKTLMVVLAFLASSLISVLLAFMREMVDAGYRSATQVEHDLGVPVLAHVPKVGKGTQKRGILLAQVADQPASAYSEAVRAIFTKLLLTSPDRTPKTLLFVSSEAGEGKTSLASAVAVILARAGRKVLLLDADIRRSPIAEALGSSSGQGLLDVLTGTATIDGTIMPGSAYGADLMLAGKFDKNYVDYLVPEKLEPLLRRLEGSYDLVVIDAPPVRILMDTQVLASIADATVLVVEWGKTRKEIVRYTTEQLLGAGAHIAGVVFSKVDVHKLSQYHYGDAGYYYGKDRKYYQ